MYEISCEEVLDQIQQYVDGELEAELTIRLADHLSSCTPCLERADFQRKLKEIVGEKCRLETPSHLVGRVRAALRAEGGPRSR